MTELNSIYSFNPSGLAHVVRKACDVWALLDIKISYCPKCYLTTPSGIQFELRRSFLNVHRLGRDDESFGYLENLFQLAIRNIG